MCIMDLSSIWSKVRKIKTKALKIQLKFTQKPILFSVVKSLKLCIFNVALFLIAIIFVTGPIAIIVIAI